MRAAAEVREQVAGPVDGHAGLVCLVLDQLAFHELALLFVFGERFVAWDPDTLVLGISLDDFTHAGLDLLEVIGGERRVPVHVVEEALVGGRTDAQLGLRIEFQGCRRQQVRRRMAVHFQRFLVAFGQEAHLGISLEGCAQVRQFAINLSDQCGARQPRADLLGYG